MEKDHLRKGADAKQSKSCLCLDDQGIPVEGGDEVLRAQAQKQVIVDRGLFDDLDVGEVLSDGRVDLIGDELLRGVGADGCLRCLEA